MAKGYTWTIASREVEGGLSVSYTWTVCNAAGNRVMSETAPSRGEAVLAAARAVQRLELADKMSRRFGGKGDSDSAGQ
jgi:hypothetical protein